MTYQETVEYLYNQLPMFTRDGPKAFKKDLTNIRLLCDYLGNPQTKFRSIHVAGTNGKGSTSNMLAAILQTAGYKTGLYTSPHIKDLRERVRLNGELVPEQFVIDFVARVKDVTLEIRPSYFELTVAMSFAYFAEQKLDIAVIETGLGGRLDSTNIVTPELSVITNISFDHVNVLGKTLEKIAFEKAGIIKQHKPVVVGEYLPETRPVFENIAAERSAPILFAQDFLQIYSSEIVGNKLQCVVSNANSSETKKYELDLTGSYQEKNLLTVLASCEVLQKNGFEITESNISLALANVMKITGLEGRWQVIGEKPLMICDVGHNEAGINLVLSQLQEQHAGKKWHFVIGFVKDKDVQKVLSLFPPNAQYYFTNAHIPRAMPVLRLKELALGIGLKGESFDDINDAVAAAKKQASVEDVIMICGSFFTLAELKTT